MDDMPSLLIGLMLALSAFVFAVYDPQDDEEWGDLIPDTEVLSDVSSEPDWDMIDDIDDEGEAAIWF